MFCFVHILLVILNISIITLTRIDEVIVNNLKFPNLDLISIINVYILGLGGRGSKCKRTISKKWNEFIQQIQCRNDVVIEINDLNKKEKII